MDSDLEAFFANAAAVKERISHDTGLKKHIRAQFSPNDRSFSRLPSGLYLKQKGNLGKIELAVTADLYQKGFPVPSFAVVVRHDREGRLTYVTEDMGDIDDSYDAQHYLFPNYNQILRRLMDKGYEPDRRSGSLFGLSGDRLVLCDLDCSEMRNNREIIDGMLGQGQFARLKDIYERLMLPENRVRIR